MSASTSRRAPLRALGAIALWGTLAALSLRLRHVPPFALVGCSLLLGAVVGLRGLSLRGLRPAVLLLGIYGLFAYHFCLFMALRLAPPVEANLINYLWPLLIVLLTPLILPGTSLRPRHLLGAAVGFGGAALLVTGGRVGLGGGSATGYLLALAAAIIWSTYSLLTKRVGHFPTSTIAAFCLVAGLLSLACHLALEPPWRPQLADLPPLLLIGLGPMGAAFYLWDRALKDGDPRVIGTLAYLTPLLSTLLIAVVGEEPLTGTALVATALIVGGALVGSWPAGPSAPPLASDPWRLFFPLGALLAWAGVLHWLLYATGLTTAYAGVFHATAQIQGFMTCMAAGFLFTFIPRRTRTPPPSAWTLALAAAAPVGAAAAAWLGAWVAAQVLWLAGFAALAAFALRRVLPAASRERVPGVFVWVPIALVAGLAGACSIAAAALLGPAEAPGLWALGRGLVLQGLFTGLVVGVGGTMLPTLTRGEPSPGAGPRGRVARALQAAAAVLFLASFPLEVWLAPRLGLALRALVAGGVLVWTARLCRLPTAPGLHRRLIWLSAWLLPAGYALAAAVPAQRVAALHVVFIGCFGLMALSVSLHVALSHGGRPDRLAGRPAAVWALGALVLLALAFRLLVGFDAPRLERWLGLSAAAFLLGTAAWAALVAPAIRAAGRPRG